MHLYGVSAGASWSGLEVLRATRNSDAEPQKAAKLTRGAFAGAGTLAVGEGTVGGFVVGLDEGSWGLAVAAPKRPFDCA